MLYRVIFFISFRSISQYHEVNLYTTRHYEADYEIYKKFEQKTGIKVNVVSGKSKPLEKRIIEEGDDCIADLFFLADAGRLYSAEKKGIFQKVKSKKLEQNIGNHFRNEFWYGITKRARVIFYNPEITKYDDVKNINYEDLASEKWRNS